MNTTSITDPLNELLAIKLYEHDEAFHRRKPSHFDSWFSISAERREYFRRMAAGFVPFGATE